MQKILRFLKFWDLTWFLVNFNFKTSNFFHRYRDKTQIFAGKYRNRDNKVLSYL